MKKYRILVTAVGAIVGYGIIESLRAGKYTPYIVGTDIFPDAVGQYFCDEFVVAEPAASSEYIPFLIKLIVEKNIDLVLFGIEQEMMVVSDHRDDLAFYLPKIAIQSKEIMDICNDKWDMAEWMSENNLSDYVIDAVTNGEFDEVLSRFGKRFLIKPRISRGGKGIAVVERKESYDYYKNILGRNFMAQRIIGDDEHEYTVGIFGLGDGAFQNAIYMRRKLSQEGATAKAEVTLNNPYLEEASARITAALKPLGPTNYQFRLEGNRVYLLEINPRISSSISIRTKFGYNEADMCIDYFLEKRIPDTADIKRGRAVRYIKDWIVPE